MADTVPDATEIAATAEKPNILGTEQRKSASTTIAPASARASETLEHPPEKELSVAENEKLHPIVRNSDVLTTNSVAEIEQEATRRLEQAAFESRMNIAKDAATHDGMTTDVELKRLEAALEDQAKLHASEKTKKEEEVKLLTYVLQRVEKDNKALHESMASLRQQTAALKTNATHHHQIETTLKRHEDEKTVLRRLWRVATAKHRDTCATLQETRKAAAELDDDLWGQTVQFWRTVARRISCNRRCPSRMSQVPHIQAAVKNEHAVWEVEKANLTTAQDSEPASVNSSADSASGTLLKNRNKMGQE